MEALISLFQKLGLTEYEAKALSVLIKNRELEAPAIARSAGVPKTRIYDVLDKLAKRGFAIDLGGRPRRYRAGTMERIFDSLIREKEAQLNELKAAVENAKKSIKAELAEDEGEKLFMVKELSDLAKVVALELKDANNYVIGFAEILPKHQAMKRILRELKERNVDVKLLHASDEEIDELKKFGIDVRAQEHGLEAYIVDGKKLVVSLGDLKRNREEYKVAIWHNAPLIEPLKDHFEKLWRKNA